MRKVETNWPSPNRIPTLTLPNQRTRARASWKGAEKSQVSPVYQQLLAKGRPKFLGYDQLTADANVLAYLPEKQELVLNQTPFYAETGGQIGCLGRECNGHLVILPALVSLRQRP